MYDPTSHNLLVQALKKCEKLGVDEAFKLRLSAGFPTIYQNFMTLYPLRSDVWDHLEKLVEILVIANNGGRPGAREKDASRESNPQWFLSPKIVGMMLYVDLFNKDLQGFIKKLDYLEELGVNFVHLMPVLRRPEGPNDGGYAVTDYRSVDERFGTMEDLQEVAAELRKRDMMFMLDMVINHTADNHEWALKAKQGEKKYQDYYYFFRDRQIPDQYEQSMPQVFPDTSPGNFTWVEEANQWVMTVFNNYQWDLNYTNPSVFNEMLKNLLFMANLGADVLRMDALAFMWKRIGTGGQNLPEAHLLIQTFKACVQIARPATIFLAEAIVAPQEIIGYFGHASTVSNECDLAYNATLMTLLWETVTTKNNRLLSVSLQNVPAKPRGTSWITYLRCHDDIGLGYEDLHASWAGYDAPSHRRFIIDFLTGRLSWSFSKGLPFMEDSFKGDARISGSLASLAGLERALAEQDDFGVQLAVDRIVMLHAVILSYGGIPMLYMGDELGLTNDYNYTADQSKADDNRWVHRPSMNWDIAESRKDKSSIPSKIFYALQGLIRARKEIQVFTDLSNNYLIDCQNQHVLAFGRYNESQKVICVFNLNDHEEWMPVQVIKREGIDTGRLIDLTNQQIIDQPYNQIRLAPYQFHWITQTSTNSQL